MQSASSDEDAESPPTCPPQVYDGGHKRSFATTVIGSSSNHDLESNKETNKESMPPSRKAPWWSRYSGYQKLKSIPPSRTRRSVLLATSAAAIALIVLLVWFAKTGRLSGFPSKV